jgi:hypothetical protein
MDDKQIDGISRRRLLKRLGAGATVAWSVPVLMSIRTPVYAQASPTCQPMDCLKPQTCGSDSACPLPPECQFGYCTLMTDGSCLCWSLGFCDPENVACETDADCSQGFRCSRTDPNCGCAGNVACVCPCEVECPDLAAERPGLLRLG